MLVNWVGGTRGQSFSFLSGSSWELWEEQPKSPSSSSSSLSPAQQRAEGLDEGPGWGLETSQRALGGGSLTSQGVLEAAAQEWDLLDLLAVGASRHVDVDHGEIM